MLFPHEKLRPSQQDFIDNVATAVKTGKDTIIHAPTGMGKTAAALAPALTDALENDKTIFFLTSRHTQHEIAIKTLQDIKERHGKQFQAVDIIGKKWMCLQPGVKRLLSGEFTEFCRTMREDGKCDYYNNLKKGEKLTTHGKLAIEQLRQQSPTSNQKIIDTSKEHKICPYYMSMELAKKAKVVIGDYYYVFHPRIREQFFARSNNELEDAIIIVDEAHNLPNRIKDLSSSRLTNIMVKRALQEAKKQKLVEVENHLVHLLGVLEQHRRAVTSRGEQEVHVTKESFMEQVNATRKYEGLVEELLDIGDKVREEQQVSYIGAVGGFLEAWTGDDEGFTRILSLRKGLREEVITLSYRCLDPSLIAKPIIDQAHSMILMSGTLTPTGMYRSVLGFSEATEVEYPSPFPDKNRLNLIIPQTSTKYTSRSEEQYQNIASVLGRTVAQIPGNVAVYFPSYYLLEQVNNHFQTLTKKTVFAEQREMNTQEKQEFLDAFRKYKDSGAVLLGVITGNFGEGIDLPGDELQGVVIVGLPLQKPDLETEALIKYYDEKFGKGWDYGYLFPAFNKALQSAGRCIRSETDRGVIVFLDERYAWPNYKRCFPKDWQITISLVYEKLMGKFFKET
ncbi:ATP-dependent DNA helicase [Candidatus Woesearchaeota archaeon]|nr:ATP-dependent DNA helicase [Candidatus Woesearchaeota archaeon]